MSAVSIVEVGPRDGLQNISETLSTALKIELITRLSKTGLKIIEATSFVSPKWIPQLSDGRAVMQAIQPLLNNTAVRYPVLVPNVKGLEAAINAGAKEVGVFVSSTESFSQKNQNCSIAESLAHAKAVADRAIPLGIRVRGYASCIFSCPYDGITDPSNVLRVTKELLEMGCFEVSLGDTVGTGTPTQVKRLLAVLLMHIPASRLAGHFHDTFGQAVANAVTAYDLGLRVFDSSVSGLGGCPYSPGAKGNLASEDIVYTFEQMGVSTGIDLEELVQVGEWISRKIGQKNGSRAGAAISARGKLQKDQIDERAIVRNWVKIDDLQEYQIFRNGHNVKVVLNRPKNGNALTMNMLHSLAGLFNKLSHDSSISTIVLAANGAYFCTGMDLSSGGVTTKATAEEAKEAQFQGLLNLFEAIDNSPQTTIAVISGSCYGGGVGLAFCCDIRLAVADVSFTLSEVKLGLSPATISKYVTREWGIGFTREATVTARVVTPRELHDKIGAVHGIAEDRAALNVLVEKKLDQLKNCAPQASAKSKELIRAAYRDPGGMQQASTIREVYDWMMRPSDEARYGIEQFRAGVREIDWGAFAGRKKGPKL